MDKKQPVRNEQICNRSVLTTFCANFLLLLLKEMEEFSLRLHVVPKLGKK